MALHDEDPWPDLEPINPEPEPDMRADPFDTDVFRQAATEYRAQRDRNAPTGRSSIPTLQWPRLAFEAGGAVGMDDRPAPPMDAYAADVRETGGKAARAGIIRPISATPFLWRDPLTIPPRPWVYGRHMMRKQVSVTVSPGGVGKSSLALAEALAVVTGRKFLGEWVSSSPHRVWVYNLEDPRDEMERRVIAAMMHHGVRPEELAGQLFIDTGRERALCTAIEVQGHVTIVRPEIDALAAEITARGIDVLIVDPFISSHRVSENASGAIDLVAKEWARVADHCNCAIELVHHTRKTNGAEATTEDGRGSSALLAAARSGRVLNRMDEATKEAAGIADDDATYFSVTRDKANLAPAGKRQWVRMASVDLGQGDSVGVAEAWKWPDTFDGMGVADLLRVQQAIEGKQARYSDQAKEGVWAGVIVAEVLGLNAKTDKKRIKRMINTWIDSDALRKVEVEGPQRRMVPTVEVGEWATE